MQRASSKWRNSAYAWLRRQASEHGLALLFLTFVCIVVWYPITLLGYTTSRAPIVASTPVPTFQKTGGWPVQDSYASALQDEPWSVLIGSSLRSGSLPMVNLYNGLGAPIAETMQAGVWYPMNLILALLPLHSPVSFDIFVLLHQLIFVYGLYALYCRFGSRLSATFFSILIGYSGVAWSNVNMVHFRSLAWLPWILLSSFIVVRLLRDSNSEKRGWIVVLIASSIAHLTAGSLQDSIIGLSVVGVCAFLYWLTQEKMQRSIAQLFRYAAAMTSAGLLSSIAIIPFFLSRARGNLAVNEGGFRVLQKVNWEYMTNWILPRWKGIYPYFVYSGTDQQNQPDIPTAVWVCIFFAFILIGGQVVLWMRQRKQGHMTREQVFIFLLMLLCTFGLVKTMHISAFDFLAHIPLIESLKFAKYNLWIAVLLGIIASWGLTEYGKLPKMQAQRILPASFFFVSFIVAGIVVATMGQQETLWSSTFPAVIQREVAIAVITNLVAVLVVCIALFMQRSHERVAVAMLCVSAVAVVVLTMPYGWYQRSERWISTGETRRNNAVVARVVERAEKDEQKVNRPRLLLASPHSNQSLLGGYENVAVWDAIIQRPYQYFFATHFSVAQPALLLQPEHSKPLMQQEIDALRFLGVQAVVGYQVQASEHVSKEVIGNAEVVFLNESLPRAFFLTEKQYTELNDLLQRDAQNLGNAVAYIQNAQTENQRRPLIQRIGTNDLQVQFQQESQNSTYEKGYLVLSQAGSPYWKMNGKTPNGFVNALYPAWQISDESSMHVTYQLPGMPLIIALSLFGLLLGIVAFFKQPFWDRKKS